jgi:peroxiredoxin
MKKIFFITFVLILQTCVTFAQGDSTSNQLPSVDIKTLENETFNTSDITNEGPIFLSFWATWCKPCIKELMAVNENYIDWADETGLKVIAVSIDDTKSSSRVAPLVNGRFAWEFDVYLDENGDFKRAMNVVNVPHSFILDKTGKVVWQHTSYSPGDEDEIYKIIKKVANGEEIKH